MHYIQLIGLAAARNGAPASVSRLHKDAACSGVYTLAPPCGETQEASISSTAPQTALNG